MIVDLAAENGGNCALTEPGTVVQRHGVHIIGYIDLPSRLAPTASFLYGNNLGHLLADMGGGAHFHVDLADEVVRGALVLLKGELMWPPPKREPVPLPQAPRGPAVDSERAEGTREARREVRRRHRRRDGDRARWPSSAWGWSRRPRSSRTSPSSCSPCFVGWQVVWNVTPALHTPLMSVTNAISGIIVIGGMLQVSGPLSDPAVIFGGAAILLATINIAGGFLVTQRMLRMFSRR